jgi:hypothetical protein
MKQIARAFAGLLLLVLAVALCACAPSARQVFGDHLEKARAAGLPLVIYAFGVPGEIRVGVYKTAVPVYVQFVVTSAVPLQSVRFVFTGYSKRGTAVRANNGKIEAIAMISSGPFRPGGNYEVNSFHARPAGFPGGSVGCIEPVRVTIRYAGGKNKTFVPPALAALLLPDLRAHCEDQGPPVYRMD